jgi:mannose-6-phosphate isomerase-like protein (cupin superfamily)
MDAKTDDRILAPMTELFRRDKDIPEQPILIVEGTTFSNPPSIKLLMVTEDMHCIKVMRKKGFVDPKHVHDDHTTIACLLTGRLRIHIGDQTHIAEPGDVWLHPQGVPHFSEALEDCIQIEVKAPACKTW